MSSMVCYKYTVMKIVPSVLVYCKMIDCEDAGTCNGSKQL